MSSANLQNALKLVRDRGFAGEVGLAIVLGTGLDTTVEGIEPIVSIAYAELAGFPDIPVSGYNGTLLIGKLEKVTIACLIGRSNYYHAGDSSGMALPLELVQMLGASHVILTNSAGSVNADIVPGTLALTTDHINLTGRNPLIGMNGEDNFVSMVNAYDERLNRRFKLAASAGGVTLNDGVCMWISGPSFETPAEIRMARNLGADMVAMSGVPETILARRLGLYVTAVSAISNYGAGFRQADPVRDETKTTARQGAIVLRRLLRAYCSMSDR